MKGKLFGSSAVAVLLLTTTIQAQDPRSGLKAGMTDAGVAAQNMELVSSQPRPEGFSTAPSGNVMAELLYANSDLAFKGNLLFLGSFQGFQIYDISTPGKPKLRTAFKCPGGQGDVSVHGNLLFMSVEMPNGTVDCTEGGFERGPSAKRFQGVRIFDVSDVEKPKQVAAVQTCRGSHTHTLVTDPKDAANVYIYVSGVQGARPASELAGCSGLPPEQDKNTAYFRIEVIKVPVAAPQNAAIVNSPRIFADSAGNIAGLWKGGPQGAGAQQTARTDQCHDITVYTEIGLAAGACAGNGILLDVSSPANPKRVSATFDPNFAYWHSATFNNDGTKVLFTDEWGGGLGPRCQASDKHEWGADAIFDIVDRKLQFASYYKLPAAQTATENCVAHNGNLVPVPGRDIMTQGWYQGGISVFDFTDSKKPVEIAYFDRGPYDAAQLHLGGVWGSYWYNGYVYSSEIGRGLDVLDLKPSEFLSKNEIEAAKLARLTVSNPQNQVRYTWPASFVVAHAYVDQLQRSKASGVDAIAADLDRIEKLSGAQKKAELSKAAAAVHKHAGSASGVDAQRMHALAQTLEGLAK